MINRQVSTITPSLRKKEVIDTCSSVMGADKDISPQDVKVMKDRAVTQIKTEAGMRTTQIKSIDLRPVSACIHNLPCVLEEQNKKTLKLVAAVRSRRLPNILRRRPTVTTKSSNIRVFTDHDNPFNCSVCGRVPKTTGGYA